MNSKLHIFVDRDKGKKRRKVMCLEKKNVDIG